MDDQLAKLQLELLEVLRENRTLHKSLNQMTVIANTLGAQVEQLKPAAPAKAKAEPKTRHKK